MSTRIWMESVVTPPRRWWDTAVARFGMRKAAIGAAAAAMLVLAVAIAAIARAGAAARIPSTHVRRGPVTIKVTESGELRARHQVTVSAINDKQILWLCPEGKAAREGDTLVVFESEKYVISSGEAESALRVAKAELEQAQNNLDAQGAKEEAARQRYESLPDLEKK